MMKSQSRYKIILEDESHLETIASYSASKKGWAALIVAFILVSVFFGSLVVVLTPVKTLLPGYLKESERTETEIQLMRLDSLRNAYEVNAAYISNLFGVMNPSPVAPDTASVSRLTVPLSVDSLLPTSEVERKFMSMMNEREKYNISVVAPLAAESLMFSSVSDEAVVTESTKESVKAELIVAKHSPVAAIADGTVIAVTQSLRDGGATVIIQHPKGFLSRISRLGTVLVEPGDKVTGGQIIAIPAKGTGTVNEKMYLEMWHNGTPLVPYEYINDNGPSLPRHPVIDVEVGRGHL